MTGHLNALPAGHKFQEYTIEAVLGQGGFGITYRAWDANLDKAVAIKEYMPVDLAVRQERSEVRPKSSEAAEDYEWGMQRFLDEARTLARFEHPNIVTVQRLFAANGTAYIVMPFQEGESLANLLKRGEKFDETRLLATMLPLLDGLEAVHALGVLHRDIKPDNIFIRRDGTPVLLDFGAARQALGDKSRSLTTIVSRGYSPFEQYTRRGVQGPWTDIYALAAVMYDMISGEPPLEATDRVQEDSIVPAAEVGNRRFSKGLLVAIDQALSLRAEDRPRSIAEFRALIEAGEGDGQTLRAAPEPGQAEDATLHFGAEQVAAGSRPAFSAAVPGGQARSLFSGSRAWAIGGGLVAVFVVVGGLFAWPLLVPAPAPGEGSVVKGQAAAPADGTDKAAAEKEARRKIEAEVRRQVEAEMRRKAEAEAQRKAAEEVRIKAGKEAQQKAAAEKQREAEAEIARKAAAEKRRKAEEKKRRKAGAKKRKPVQKAAKMATGRPTRLRSVMDGAEVFRDFPSQTGTRNERWKFSRNGTVSGRYQQTHMANEQSEVIVDQGRDVGRWSVNGNTLCVQWQKWADGRRRCYTIVEKDGHFYARTASGARAWRLLPRR